MKPTITRHGNITIVRFAGQLDHETIQPALDEAERVSKEKGHKIVFNMQDAKFVGSSNVTRLIRAIKPLNRKSEIRAKICCANGDFKRLFKAFQGRDPFEIFESEDEAINSCDN